MARTANVIEVKLVVVQGGWDLAFGSKVSALHNTRRQVGPEAEVELSTRLWLQELCYRAGCRP